MWKTFMARAEIQEEKEMENTKIDKVEDYIASFPEDIQELLKELREAVRETAPEAMEKISYGMPTFAMDGNIIHFAAFKNHIGLYPGADGVAAFQDELKPYKTSKGTIQFSLDQPLPMNLIKRIVNYKVEENKERTRLKTEKKKNK